MDNQILFKEEKQYILQQKKLAEIMNMNSSNLELLFLAHVKNDDELFHELAMQIIKDEERKNHHLLAAKLKQILDDPPSKNEYSRRSNSLRKNIPPIPRDNEKGFPLLEVNKYHYNWNDLIVKTETEEILHEITVENQERHLLSSYGLKPKNKILFCGPPGTGKTLTAKIISSEIGYPLITVKFESVVSSYLGETSTNLKKIFDYIEKGRWVVLFDEFDIIGKKRDDPTEHGEIKRVVNNFMLMLENFRGDSILIASTNHPHILDSGVWRRFDEVVTFELPDTKCRNFIFHKKFSTFWKEPGIDLTRFALETEGFSGSDIEQVTVRAIKHTLIDKRQYITCEDLSNSVDRQKRIIAAREV